MSTRPERRRKEKAMKKLQNRKFTMAEIQELMNRARLDTLELALGIFEKTNAERARETRKNQYHLLLERQVRMRYPALNRLLDENSPFMEREGKKDDDNREDGADQ